MHAIFQNISICFKDLFPARNIQSMDAERYDKISGGIGGKRRGIEDKHPTESGGRCAVEEQVIPYLPQICTLSLSIIAGSIVEFSHLSSIRQFFPTPRARIAELALKSPLFVDAASDIPED